MTTQIEQREYHVDSQPIEEPAVPMIFTLKYNKLGKEAVALMNDRFRGNPNVELDTSRLKKNKPIVYSNTFRRYALGDAVRELTGWNVSPITPAESELALREGTLPGNPEEYWEDLGFALYAEKGPNEQLKQHLLREAKDRGLEVELQLPAMATSLTAVPDGDFEDGVRLDLGHFGEIYHVPILMNESGDFNAGDPQLVNAGLPSTIGEGSRFLYTRDNGLARFCRDRNLNLGAYFDNLPSSLEAGRVNFVKFKKSRF